MHSEIYIGNVCYIPLFDAPIQGLLQNGEEGSSKKLKLFVWRDFILSFKQKQEF